MVSQNQAHEIRVSYAARLREWLLKQPVENLSAFGLQQKIVGYLDDKRNL